MTRAKPRAAAMAMRTPVKLPGPKVAAIRSSAGEVEAGSRHHLGHHGHQGLGVAARHSLLAKDDALRRPAGEKHCGAAGAHAGVEGQDVHRASDDARHLVEAEARRAGNSTAASP